MIDFQKTWKIRILSFTNWFVLGLAVVVFYSLYHNSSNHAEFRRALDSITNKTVGIQKISNDQDLLGYHLLNTEWNNAGTKHQVKVRLVVHPDSKFTSTGVIGPYYFENMGLWWVEEDVLNLVPTIGSGTRLPFYGELVIDKDKLSTNQNFEYINEDYIPRIPPEEYHYTVWKDPRFYVGITLIISFGVLRRHLMAYQGKNQAVR
ncbi:hypothetical protein AB6E94_18870 [Vibrio lentus]|uniref:hypothetical protein n=1 Tax=Vibrio splendidus TaxID=29497 RepID=UPI000C866E30|nr:hypothetical protein [Vibrio splendidus]PMG17944.1 hypothetical protein BCU98_01000 [Vibrio splendidus]